MRHIHTYNQTIKKECSLHQKLNRFYDGYYTEKDIEPNSDIDQKCIMPSQKGLFTSYMIKKARTFIPLYPHGNLDQFLQFLEASPHRENKRIRLTVALKVLQCIEADAHALNIAHNDIKGANMMIGWPEHIAPCIEELPRYIEHMNCQLIDYGFSENLDGKPSEDAFMVDTAGAYDLLMLCLSPEHQNLIAMYDQMKPDLDMLQTIKRRLELLLDDSSERNLKLLAACCSEPMSYI